MEHRDKVSTVKGDTHDDLLDQGRQRAKAGADKLDRAVPDDHLPGERSGSRDARDADARPGDGI
jgi:hypothetical protein